MLSLLESRNYNFNIKKSGVGRWLAGSLRALAVWDCHRWFQWKTECARLIKPSLFMCFRRGLMWFKPHLWGGLSKLILRPPPPKCWHFITVMEKEATKKQNTKHLFFFLPFLFSSQSCHVALADLKLPVWTRLTGVPLTETCLPLLWVQGLKAIH